MDTKAIPWALLLFLFTYLFITTTASACPPFYQPKLRPLNSDGLAAPVQLPDRVNKPKDFNYTSVGQEKLQPVDNSLFNELPALVFVTLLGLALLLTCLIAIITERILFFISARKPSEEFVDQFKGALQNHHSLAAFNLAVDYVKKPTAKLTLHILRTLQTFSGAEPGFFERGNFARLQALVKSDSDLKQWLWSLRIITRLALLVGFIGTTANLLAPEHNLWANLADARISFTLHPMLLGILIAIVSRLAHNRLALLARQISLEVYNASWETFACLIRHQIDTLAIQALSEPLCFDY